jgi:hypothetical protein
MREDTEALGFVMLELMERGSSYRGNWVDQHLHFGIKVTSPIEGCHPVLKTYLRVSTADLKGVFDPLLPFWPVQHQAIECVLAAEQNQVKHIYSPQHGVLLLLHWSGGLSEQWGWYMCCRCVYE